MSNNFDNFYNEISNDFPMLNAKERFVYLDTAATSLKPKSVLDAISNYYENYTTNVHRSIHKLGEEVTKQYEGTRDKLQKFLNSKHREEIIFTKGTTESLNLLARTLEEELNSDDEIILSELEHHSNIVPWQLLEKRKKIKIKVIKLTKDLNLDIEDFKSKINEKTKLVSITGMSNVLGVITPLEEIIKIAHEKKAIVICDAAQLVVHKKIDVQKLDIDFLTFSAHKLYGPTGVGVLYGKKDLLEKLPPYLGGGDMIDKVSFEGTTYNDLPYRLEAGTPNISGVLSFGKAIDYVNNLNEKKVHEYESYIYDYAYNKISSIKDIQILSPKDPNNVSIISFVVNGIHIHDLASLLAMDKIAIRTGHHCAQPLHQSLKQKSSARVSLAFYNSIEDIDKLYKSLLKAIDILK